MRAPGVLPIWIVRFGTSERVYFTEHHARQEEEALKKNGTPVTVEEKFAVLVE